MIALPQFLEQLERLFIVSAVDGDARLAEKRQAALRMRRALGGELVGSSRKIAMPEERKAERRTQAWRLRL